jgi:type III pantothenate kinase
VIAPRDRDEGPQLLLVDIGNSHVALAPYIDGKRGEAVRIETDPFEAGGQPLLRQWEALSATARRIVIVSSVCPPALNQLRQWCEANDIGPLLVLGEDLGAPIGADLPAPEKVGMDRLCVAAAAYAKVQSACVVADFGTALTVDLISDNGVFLGGTILPGVNLSAKALKEHTALLPLVTIERPTSILGKDTEHAINSGIFAMMCGALREITEQYATDIGRWPPLIVTGGDAELIGGACDFVDHIVPDLCLDGIALAYEQAVQQADESA